MSKNFFTKSNLIKISVFIFLFLISVSNSSFAQTKSSSALAKVQSSTSDVGNLLGLINKNILQNAITLLGGAALIVFLWGMILFIVHRQQSKDGQLEQDKKMMLWSLVAMFVFVSVWGIIKLFQGFIGITSEDMVLPRICTNGSCNSVTTTKSAANGVVGDTVASSSDFNSPTNVTGDSSTGDGNTPTNVTGDSGLVSKLTNTDCTAANIDNWPSTLSTNSSDSDSDNSVSQLQSCMKTKGGYDLGTTGPKKDGVDGQFGSMTEDAVKSFQTKYKLASDGQVGPATRAVLVYRILGESPDSDIENKYNITDWPDELKSGDKDSGDNTDVADLQQFLLDKGCYSFNSLGDGNKDGDFGPNTVKAVDAYQTANSLKEDQIVGPSTRAVMSSPDTSDCKKSNPSSQSTSNDTYTYSGTGSGTGSGNVPNGGVCNTSYDCSNGSCSDGKCVASSDSGSDVTAGASGAYCNTNSECLSGVCNSDKTGEGTCQ